MDNNSLAHTKWECKYHIVFALLCFFIVSHKRIKFFQQTVNFAIESIIIGRTVKIISNVCKCLNN